MKRRLGLLLIFATLGLAARTASAQEFVGFAADMTWYVSMFEDDVGLAFCPLTEERKFPPEVVAKGDDDYYEQCKNVEEADVPGWRQWLAAGVTGTKHPSGAEVKVQVKKGIVVAVVTLGKKKVKYPTIGTHRALPEIVSVVWSPDGKYVGINVKGNPEESATPYGFVIPIAKLKIPVAK